MFCIALRRRLCRRRCCRRRLLQLLQFLLLAGQRHRRMIVESLRHQLQCQRILGATGLFQLGPLVLEPDLDLRLIQAQFAAQLLATLLGQVAILVELVLEERDKGERGGREGGRVLDSLLFVVQEGEGGSQLTFSRASCVPLNAVRGRLSSATPAAPQPAAPSASDLSLLTLPAVALDVAGFFGLRVRGPVNGEERERKRERE